MTEIKKTRSIGLKAICVGAINPNGGMAADLKRLGKTFKGTASFNTEADTSQAFYSEEQPSVPEEKVTTEAGLKSLKWNLMEWDNAALVMVFGGSTKKEDVTIDEKTYTVEKYVAPRETATIELSVRAISRFNVVIDIPRALVTARFVWNMTQTDIAQIEITAEVLAPTGSSGPFEIYKLTEPKSDPPQS